MNIKNKLSICVALGCIAFALVGCGRTAVNAQGNQMTQKVKVSVEKNYFLYEDLPELSIDKNADSENIKSIINKLPILADYLEIKDAKIENTDIGVGLVLEYDEIYDKAKQLKLSENPLYHSPYFNTFKFNNSMLLMLENEYISYIKTVVNIPKEYVEGTEEKIVDEISRESLLQKNINFEYMKENQSYYNELLEFNNAIYADRLFYNRIRLGSDEETLLLRNGNPDKKEEKDDLESIYTYGDENSYTLFKLTPKNNGSGELEVSAISVHPNKEDINGGELLYNLGLLPNENEYLKKVQVTDYLGDPVFEIADADYYRISSDISDYLYFIYSEGGEVIEYGICKWIIPVN